MPSTFRNSFYAGLLVALSSAIYLLRLWSAENQVRLHSEHLVSSGRAAQLERGRRILVAALSRRWNNDRARLLHRLATRRPLLLRSHASPLSDAHSRSSGERHLAGAHAARGRGEAAARDQARVNSLNDALRIPLAPRKLEAVGLEARRSGERIAHTSAGRVLSPLISAARRRKTRHLLPERRAAVPSAPNPLRRCCGGKARGRAAFRPGNSAR